MSRHLCLTAIGHHHPEHVVSNEFLASLDIDTSPEWIQERTGIRCRRSVLTLDQIRMLRDSGATSQTLRDQALLPAIGDLVKPAWESLAQRFDTPAESHVFDAVICGSSVSDWHIPAQACVVADAMRVKGPSFDVNSACSSFVVDLHVAAGLSQLNPSFDGLVINPERYSLAMNYSDRASCILFGDGATVARLQSLDSPKGLVLQDTCVHSDPTGRNHVVIPMGSFFTQNGRAVQKFAVSKTVQVVQEILERNRLTTRDIAFFVGHQANLRMLESCVDKLGLPKEAHLFNVDEYGNQGAAGAPAVLSQNWEKLRSGDRVVVAVVGSGLTWGAALFERV